MHSVLYIHHCPSWSAVPGRRRANGIQFEIWALSAAYSDAISLTRLQTRSWACNVSIAPVSSKWPDMARKSQVAWLTIPRYNLSLERPCPGNRSPTANGLCDWSNSPARVLCSNMQRQGHRLFGSWLESGVRAHYETNVLEFVRVTCHGYCVHVLKLWATTPSTFTANFMFPHRSYISWASLSELRTSCRPMALKHLKFVVQIWFFRPT